MRKLDTVDFRGKKVLVRVDFNVPLNSDFEVTDETRIIAAVPTLRVILNGGGKLIIMSHLGRPKGKRNPDFSLSSIVSNVSSALNRPVGFVDDCIGEKVESAISLLEEGDVLLLENLRYYAEETNGDVNFAEKLASLADFYVNDAFGTAHREHASTSIIANFFEKKCCFGLLMESEIDNVNKVLNSVEKPVTAVVGGAKVSSKIDIILNLIDRVDNIVIGGGMAYTFALAKGGKVGNSLVEEDKTDLALKILNIADQKGVKIIVPIDSVNADEFNNEANIQLSDIMNITDGFMGLDIGPKSIDEIESVLLESNVILWNGPMGVFEFENFSTGTKSIGNAIVKATKEGAFSLVGGGDSVAAAKQFGLADGLSYISTGGGAMLEFLEGKTLPGVAAIMKANQA